MTNEEKALRSDLLELMELHKVALIGYGGDVHGQNQEYYFEGDNVTLNIFHLLEVENGS